MAGAEGRAPQRGSLRQRLAWTRAGAWWEFKLLPVLAVAYAACLATGQTPYARIGALAWLLIAIVPGAVFVSILNDFTDRDDDRRAGKRNGLAGVRPALPLAMLALCLAAGIAIAWQWDRLLQASYAIGWIAYLLYSVAPVRLKTRGLAGALCDAIGANVVPALLAALLVVPPSARSLPWLGLVAIWSLCFGLRGIFWHQIADVANDRGAGVSTWVARVGVDRAARVARTIVAPAELAALALLIALSGRTAATGAIAALALYLWLLDARIDRFEMRVTLVRDLPRSTMLMHEYYDVFLPLALLVAASVVDGRNLALLVLHLILFPRRWRQAVRDVIRLADPRYESWRRGNRK